MDINKLKNENGDAYNHLGAQAYRYQHHNRYRVRKGMGGLDFTILFDHNIWIKVYFDQEVAHRSLERMFLYCLLSAPSKGEAYWEDFIARNHVLDMAYLFNKGILEISDLWI